MNQRYDAGATGLSFPLLVWYLRRYRWLYLASGLFLVGFFAILALGAADALGALMVMWSLPALYLAFMTPVFFLHHRIGDGTFAFFLTRPLARRQVYDTVLGAGFLPLFLAGVLPVAVVWFLFYGHSVLLPSDRVAWANSLLLAFWCIFVYQFSVWALLHRAPVPRGSSFLTVSTVGWAAVLGASVWMFSPAFFGTHRAFARTLASLEPWPVILAFALTLACYLAGRRQFEKLDL